MERTQVRGKVFLLLRFLDRIRGCITCCCARVNREGKTDCENQAGKQECDPVLEKGLAPYRRKAASLLLICVQMQSDCRFQGMKVERVLIDDCYFYVVKIK